jgi:BirA family biotin operon repressor/biotin-[acetyl-CoA-carboxylase] ligase
VALKWPNDLVLGREALTKAGGILVELRAESAGAAHMVVGIGLNLRCPAAIAQAIEPGALPAAGLDQAGIAPASRNALAASLIDECTQGLACFAEQGFAPFREAWRADDALRDRAVRVAAGTSTAPPRDGHARGIDESGALLFEGADGLRSALLAGEVSVRGQDLRGRDP